MSYLLDTNACIAVINGRPAGVRANVQRSFERGTAVLLSCITSFELWYGVAKSARVAYNTERLEVFLAAMATIPFDDGDAEASGEIRAALEKAGTPIGAYDCLIAGQALRRGLTLVTANAGEFKRVSGLDWEDWAA